MKESVPGAFEAPVGVRRAGGPALVSPLVLALGSISSSVPPATGSNLSGPVAVWPAACWLWRTDTTFRRLVTAASGLRADLGPRWGTRLEADLRFFGFEAGSAGWSLGVARRF